MSQLAKKTRVLTLIRRYLEAGMMADGLVQPRTEGTPQGGPLSPLLSNILLTELDRELERRGHASCRYADDCNIYVASKRAGVGLLQSLTGFLAQRLKLKVNGAKSAVARPWQRKFLGYSLTWHMRPKLRIAGASLGKLTAKVKALLRDARGRNLGTTIQTLNPVLRGWAAYFKLTETKRALEEQDGYGTSCAVSCGASGDDRTRVRACCCNVDCWKSWRGARRAASAARGGTRARATCTLPFRNPGLSLSGWCRCSIPCSASSAFHEPPYAEPHVRWCVWAAVIPPPTRL